MGQGKSSLDFPVLSHNSSYCVRTLPRWF